MTYDFVGFILLLCCSIIVFFGPNLYTYFFSFFPLFSQDIGGMPDNERYLIQLEISFRINFLMHNYNIKPFCDKILD